MSSAEASRYPQSNPRLPGFHNPLFKTPLIHQPSVFQRNSNCYSSHVTNEEMEQKWLNMITGSIKLQSTELGPGLMS